MNVTYAIKTENLMTIASGSHEDWKDTFSVLKSEGIKFDYKKFSDYTGPAIPCDSILYYDAHSSECQVSCPSYMF
jgi:hypothetical protein